MDNHRDVMVVFGHVAEGGQAFAEPHGHLTVHVDGEGLEALLQAAHGVELKRAGVLPQIHTAHLRQTQTTDRDETWRTERPKTITICIKLSKHYITVQPF